MEDVFGRDFDDVAVGDGFSTRARTITEGDIASFAALTGDTHPQHTDAVWAARSAFGERIAHGMLVVSYAVGLIPFDPERIVALRRLGDAVFKRPVAIGDTIHARGRVERMRALDAATGLASLRLDVLNQHDRLVVRAIIDVLWRRGGRPPSARGAEEQIDLGGLPL